MVVDDDLVVALVANAPLCNSASAVMGRADDQVLGERNPILGALPGAELSPLARSLEYAVSATCMPLRGAAPSTHACLTSNVSSQC